MIRIGIRTEFEAIPEMAQIGFDYIEAPLTRIAALSEEEFSQLAEYVRAADIPLEAAYDLLPDSLRVNGPSVSAQALHAYLDRAFARLHALGVQIAAFDAPSARSVPAGFDFAMARRQTGNFLRMAQRHASQYGLKVAVQNYRRTECNLINTISEASLMAALLQLDNVGVLADTVQMALASESLDAVERAGSSLMHVHTGAALSRTLPHDGDGEDYEKLFGLLAQCGYTGRVSCVGTDSANPTSAKAALSRLTRARDRACGSFCFI